jgi:hypothetical protein
MIPEGSAKFRVDQAESRRRGKPDIQGKASQSSAGSVRRLHPIGHERKPMQKRLAILARRRSVLRSSRVSGYFAIFVSSNSATAAMFFIFSISSGTN